MKKSTIAFLTLGIISIIAVVVVLAHMTGQVSMMSPYQEYDAVAIAKSLMTQTWLVFIVGLGGGAGITGAILELRNQIKSK
jgi:hypothetical protein